MVWLVQRQHLHFDFMWVLPNENKTNQAPSHILGTRTRAYFL